jgi:hypothetical protein
MASAHQSADRIYSGANEYYSIDWSIIRHPILQIKLFSPLLGFRFVLDYSYSIEIQQIIKCDDDFLK